MMHVGLLQRRQRLHPDPVEIRDSRHPVFLRIFNGWVVDHLCVVKTAQFLRPQDLSVLKS